MLVFEYYGHHAVVNDSKKIFSRTISRCKRSMCYDAIFENVINNLI